MFYSLAGSQFQIGAAPIAMKSTAFAVADFAGVTWTTIGEVESLAPVVTGSKPVEFDALFPAFKRRVKGARDFGTTDLVYAMDSVDLGQIGLTLAEQAAGDYPFHLIFADATPGIVGVVTVTIATPGVFTLANHGLAIGSAVKLSTTGLLPTGVVAATTYYVQSVPSSSTFTLALTKGGAAIATSGTQSGVHTVTSTPAPSERYFIAKVMAIEDTVGGTEDTAKRKATLAINCQPVAVQATP